MLREGCIVSIENDGKTQKSRADTWRTVALIAAAGVCIALDAIATRYHLEWLSAGLNWALIVGFWVFVAVIVAALIRGVIDNADSIIRAGLVVFYFAAWIVTAGAALFGIVWIIKRMWIAA